MTVITKHCVQRLSERFLLDIPFKEFKIIRRLIQSGYYILIEVEEGQKVKLLTRYKGRYIKFVMSNDFKEFITALPYHPNDMQYIEQFVKEFDK